MKYSFTLLFLISFFSNSQDPSVTEHYGQKIDFQGIDNYYSVKNDLLKVNKKHVKIKGKILSSCPMKGCWMKVNVDNDTLLVRFKDYGFFVPKSGLEGKSTILSGIISIDTLSVAQLKHYAEDAGKTLKEINLIKNSQLTLSVLADGVLIE
jgi:hypothetical protein|tara:strand:+ start:1661 stop:2113 length:453 start_codon:yes stop_codon:yes gene_type:complete